MINPFGLLITIITYAIAQKSRLKLVPPLLLSAAFIIVILKIFNINYSIYDESASFLTFMLAPATIALGYPLSQNLKMLTKNKRAIYFGLLFASLTSIISTYIIGTLFHVNFEVILSLLPKSVTTPIAVEISKSIHGIPELTACIVIFTGLVGGLFAHRILKYLKINSDIAVGISIGASSHVMGTSRCAEEGKESQVAVSTLALILVGLMTAVIAPVIVLLITHYR